jgi:hypothetical protein
MHSKDAIRQSLNASDMIADAYLKDLGDADLLVRPVEGMNHMAWQLGHLIGSERNMVEMVKPGSCPPLPEGFDEGHGRQSFTEDDPAKFYGAARYHELRKAQRAATLKVLDEIDESELDRTDPKFPQFAPTCGALLNMAGHHVLMHVGQWVAVRKKLGKPVSI